MGTPPPNTEWTVYYDAQGNLLKVEQQGQEAPLQFDIMAGDTNLPPQDYQFLGARSLGELSRYRDAKGMLHNYIHFLCRLYCL